LANRDIATPTVTCSRVEPVGFHCVISVSRMRADDVTGNVVKHANGYACFRSGARQMTRPAPRGTIPSGALLPENKGASARGSLSSASNGEAKRSREKRKRAQDYVYLEHLRARLGRGP